MLNMDLEKIRNRSILSNILTLGDDFILVDNISNAISNEDLDATDLEPTQIKDHIALSCVGGSMKMRLNWNDLEIHKNDVIVVRPGDIASLVSMTDCKLFMIGFSNLFSIQSLDPKVATLFIQNLSNNACTHLDDDQFKKVITMYKSMRKILAIENFDFKEEAINGIMQIGCAFASQWICDYAKKEINSDKHESSQHQIFKKFLELVAEHHQKERTVTFYANKLCITPKYLSQLVVNVSGKYAYDIIRDQVIFRAKALLKSKQYSVQQVADELSFSNVSFFCKYFRESVGMSPKSYMLNKIS